jgi:RNA polymerase sigma-70 factor (ECF subfamily)
MAEVPSFQEFLRRVRAGDEQAASELVRLYEPEIRRAVRVRLSESRLGRILDTEDVCQSVLANFFVRASAGQFEIESPEQLVHLLVAMARNKLRDKARQQTAQRRDQRRLGTGDPAALDAVPDSADSPSQIIAGRELLERVRGELSDEERFLAEQRALGHEWAAIAAEVGGSPEALRKKLERAIERVMRRLGLEA